MKSIKFIACGLTALLFAACGGPKTSFTINGAIEGLPDGTVVELFAGAVHTAEAALAEAVAKDGKFTLTGSAPEPRMFYVSVKQIGGLKLMAENGDRVTFTGKATLNGERYRIEEQAVKGSATHELYLQKTAPRGKLDSLYTAYTEANREVSAEMGKARQAKDAERIKEISESDAYKKLETDEHNFFTTVEATIKGIIMDSKDSWWGPMLMLDMMTRFEEPQKAWYEEFSQEAKDSYYGKIVKEDLYPVGFVGQRLPDFTLTDDNGGETNVLAVAAGKKYILIDFWASWCAPCRKEIPNLKSLYEKYSAKEFEIISISTDKEDAEWRKALKDEQLPWPNFRDTKDAAVVCKIKFIPMMYLLDANGKVIAENIRGEALQEKLAELFK